VKFQTKKLKQAKLFRDLIIDSSTIPIIVTDRNWRWIKVNPAFEKLFGYKTEEVLGKSNYELPIWTTEEYKRCSDTVTRLLEKEKGKPIEIETFCKTKDGRELNILLREVFLEEEVSKEIGFIGYLFDITELRKQEEELREREAELNQALASSRDVLDKVAQKGDLSARIDVKELSGKHKQIGRDINKIVGSLQDKIEELRKREEELKKRDQEQSRAIHAFSETLGQAAGGDFSVRIDTRGWNPELGVIGMAINSLIGSLEFEKKQKG
jgi:PAS domain S-box-containing protein